MGVVASSARKSIPPPNIKNVVIKRCRKGLQKIEEAVEMFGRMTNSKRRPSNYAFNVLLAATARMKQYPTVISLFGKMNRNEGGGIIPDACSYRILTYKMNRTDLGFGAFSSLMKRGFRPDTISFSTLINGLSSKKRIDETVEVFDRMPLMDSRRNVITDSTIIDAHCKEVSMNKALGLPQDMIFKGILPNDVTCSTIIDARSKYGSMEMALKLLQEMIFKGILPDVTYNCVLLGHCSLGQWKEADGIHQQMLGRRIFPNAMTSTTLADGLSKSRRMDKALNYFNRMKQEGLKPDIVAYSSLIDGLCKVGRMDEARTLLDEMIDRGIHPDVVTCNTLIDALCEVGRAEDAQAVLGDMLYQRIDPNEATFHKLIYCLCEEGMANEALILMDVMMECDLFPDLYMYLFIDEWMPFSRTDEESNESGAATRVVTWLKEQQRKCSHVARLLDAVLERF